MNDVVENISKYANYKDSVNLHKAFNMVIPRSVHKKNNDRVVRILTEDLPLYNSFKRDFGYNGNYITLLFKKTDCIDCRLTDAWGQIFTDVIREIDEMNGNYWRFEPEDGDNGQYIVIAGYNFIEDYSDSDIPNYSDYSSDSD